MKEMASSFQTYVYKMIKEIFVHYFAVSVCSILESICHIRTPFLHESITYCVRYLIANIDCGDGLVAYNQQVCRSLQVSI